MRDAIGRIGALGKPGAVGKPGERRQAFPS
jgi:hypothetical protein